MSFLPNKNLKRIFTEKYKSNWIHYHVLPSISLIANTLLYIRGSNLMIKRYTTMFFVIFTKANKLCDFLFVFLADEAIPK